MRGYYWRSDISIVIMEKPISVHSYSQDVDIAREKWPSVLNKNTCKSVGNPQEKGDPNALMEGFRPMREDLPETRKQTRWGQVTRGGCC